MLSTGLHFASESTNVRSLRGTAAHGARTRDLKYLRCQSGFTLPPREEGDYLTERHALRGEDIVRMQSDASQREGTR